MSVVRALLPPELLDAPDAPFTSGPSGAHPWAPPGFGPPCICRLCGSVYYPRVQRVPLGAPEPVG